MLATSKACFSLSQNTNLDSRKKIQNYLYDTKKILGKGNFSTVHPGINTLTNEAVAVKVVRLDSLTSQKRADLLEDEISILCSMNHPNIIRCFEVLKSTNNCYIITELCEQGNLEAFLKKRKNVSEEEIWPYIRDIYQGLKYLSSLGIVHRDLKPANIFLKKNEVKIADFGFAVHARHLFHDLNIGSPLYMPPEGYIDNMYGPKTDVWAFGIIIYELLHGRTLGSHCINEDQLKYKMNKGISEEDIKVKVSPELKQLLFKCLVRQNARITIEEIENLPYFRKHQRVPLNISNCSTLGFSRCQSTPNVRSALEDYNQPGKQVYIHQSPNKRQNVSFGYPQPQVSQHFPKRRLLKKESIEETLSSADSSNEDNFGETRLLKGKVNFNDSLGLIHFCRIGFALLKESLEERLKSLIKNAIIRILQDLLNMTNSGMINYEISQTKNQKESKLKHVLSQYLQKYKTFPIQNRCLLQVNCQKQKKMLASYLTFLENKPNKKIEEIYSMNLMLIFLIFSQQLHRGTIRKDYSNFSQSNILETCLANKEQFSSMDSYYQLKNKYPLNG